MYVCIALIFFASSLVGAAKDEFYDPDKACDDAFPNSPDTTFGIQLPYSCAVNCQYPIKKACGFCPGSEYVGQTYVPDGSPCSKFATYDTDVCVNQRCTPRQ